MILSATDQNTFQFQVYDAIALDCDGVVLDSNKMKTAAFDKAMRTNGFEATTIQNAINWQSRSFGLSRYKVFQEILSGRFGPVPTSNIENLINEFGSIVHSDYLEIPQTPGLISALQELRKHASIYIVSGSDEIELRDVFIKRKLHHWFCGIFGSPNTKIENIKRLKDNYFTSYKRVASKILFVGDAIADMDAAMATDCDFVFMAPYSCVQAEMRAQSAAKNFPIIDKLGDLLNSP